MITKEQTPFRRLMPISFSIILRPSLVCLMIGCLGIRAEPQRSSLPPPDRIRDILTRGSEAHKKNLANALNLFLPPRTRWGDQKQLCVEYESITGQGFTVDLHQVVLKAPGPQAVLVAKPQDCEYQFLVVLEEKAPGRWAQRGTIPIFAKNWEPEISFYQLINSNEFEIVVRNHVTDAGTGMLQRNMTVFKLSAGGLRIIFDEAEKQALAIPTTRNGQPMNTDQSQESEFWLIDAEPWETSIKQIVEKQVIRDHQTKIVRWWVFIWRPELEIFEAVATDGNPGEGKEGTIKLSSPDLKP